MNHFPLHRAPLPLRTVALPLQNERAYAPRRCDVSRYYDDYDYIYVYVYYDYDYDYGGDYDDGGDAHAPSPYTQRGKPSQGKPRPRPQAPVSHVQFHAPKVPFALEISPRFARLLQQYA